jgi:hypothetical protein
VVSLPDLYEFYIYARTELELGVSINPALNGGGGDFDTNLLLEKKMDVNSLFLMKNKTWSFIIIE